MVFFSFLRVVKFEESGFVLRVASMRLWDVRSELQLDSLVGVKSLSDILVVRGCELFRFCRCEV